MKYLIMIASVAMLSGCGDSGSPACANSPLVKTWAFNWGSSSADTIDIKSDCSFVEVNCEQSGTLENIQEKSGEAVVTIEKQGVATNANCKGPGKNTCTYVVAGNSLNLNCK